MEFLEHGITFLQVLSSTAASSAIAALSPGGVLMQAATQQTVNRECVTHTHTHTCWKTLLKCALFYFQSLSNSEMVPSDVQGELKHLYAAAGELLRHFWSCFPVNTPFLEEKASQFHLMGALSCVLMIKWGGFFCLVR